MERSHLIRANDHVKTLYSSRVTAESVPLAATNDYTSRRSFPDPVGYLETLRPRGAGAVSVLLCLQKRQPSESSQSFVDFSRRGLPIRRQLRAISVAIQ